jgi:hypothetical protein
MTFAFWKNWGNSARDEQAASGPSAQSRPLQVADERSSMVSRNPAPDASQSSEPTPGRTFTVGR